MIRQGLRREGRAGVFALFCVSLSGALHSAVEGMLPSALALLAGLGLTWIVALLLAGSERGFLTIAATLFGVEAGLHGLFQLVPADCSAGQMPAAGPLTELAAPYAEWAGVGGLMVTVHVMAGLAAAAWLRAGEAALSALRSWLTAPLTGLRLLLALLGVTVPATKPLRRPVARPVAIRSDLWWRHGVVRRGPPAFA